MGFSLFNVDENGFSDRVQAPLKKGILYEEFEAKELTCVFTLRYFRDHTKGLYYSELESPFIYRNGCARNGLPMPRDISPRTFCEVAREYKQLAEHFFVILDKLLLKYEVEVRMFFYNEDMGGYYFGFSARLLDGDNKFNFGSANGLEFYIPCEDMLEVD